MPRPEQKKKGSVAKTGVAWERGYWSFGLGMLGRQAVRPVCWKLSLPDYMHRLVAPQGSPGRWERAEPQPHLDQLFDESMVLLDQVIEVFD